MCLVDSFYILNLIVLAQDEKATTTMAGPGLPMLIQDISAVEPYPSWARVVSHRAMHNSRTNLL